MTGRTYQGRAFIFNREVTNLSTGFYNVIESDQLISCDTTLGDIDITLLPIGDQWDYEYKLYILDLSGTSSANNINIYAPVDHLINGQSSVAITNDYGSALIRSVDSKNYIAEFGRPQGTSSGDCITDLYVSHLNSCSPLHIQDTSVGDVLIGENGGVNVGIGTNNPLYKLDVNGGGRFSGNSLTVTPLSLNGTNSFGSSIGLFQTDVSMNKNSLAFVGTTSTAMGLGVNFNSGIPEKVYISNMSGNDIFHFMENGCMGIGVFNPSESLEVSGKTKTSTLQITSPYVPTGSADTNGNVGDVSWDETYFYWKTSTNGWLRTSGQTW